MRQNFSSGSPYEPIVGYSRAVKIGNMICVSGTTGSGDDISTQTAKALETIGAALRALGADFKDVVRVRVYVVDVQKNWETVGRALGQVFGEIRPANTMVGVASLVSPDMLVEIDADAVISE